MSKHLVIRMVFLISVLVTVSGVLSGCRSNRVQAGSLNVPAKSSPNTAQEFGNIETTSAADRQFVLQTQIINGRMVFVGLGEPIDGLVNPDLVVEAGETVRVTLINQDGLPHDLSLPALQVKTSQIASKGSGTVTQFPTTENQRGTYDYFCTTAGHRLAGMQGKLIVR